jgi:hypothetical protein
MAQASAGLANKKVWVLHLIKYAVLITILSVMQASR